MNDLFVKTLTIFPLHSSRTKWERPGVPGRSCMSANLETVKGIYQGGPEQIARNLQAALAPRFEWTEAAGFPYAGTYRSLDEVAQNVFARLAGEWENYRAEAENFYDAGDTIVVTGRYLGTC